MVGLTRHQRRIAAWIACFAVLLASLAPSISHALVLAGFLDANPVSPTAWSGVPAPRSALARPHASHMEGMDIERTSMESTSVENTPMESTSMASMSASEATPPATRPAPDTPHGQGHHSHNHHAHLIAPDSTALHQSDSTAVPPPDNTALAQTSGSPDGALPASPSATTQTRTTHSDAGHTPAMHSPAMHFEHCPFCFTHAGSFGLPFVASIVLPTVGAAAVAPLLFYRAPRPLFAWTAPQSRAPPIPS
jgi:hypothetical protein